MRRKSEARDDMDQTPAKGRVKRGMVQTEAKAVVDRTDARYAKEQVLESRRYRGQRDLVCALLEEGKRYSLEEVDGLLKDYLKGRVM